MQTIEITPVAVLHSISERFERRSTWCKFLSLILVALVLLLILTKTGGAELLWVLAPIVLLAVIDSAARVEVQRITQLLWTWSSKDQNDSSKVVELLRAHIKGPGYPRVLRNLLGVFSFSVAPFYLSIVALVAFLQVKVIGPAEAKAAEAHAIQANGNASLAHSGNSYQPYRPNTILPQSLNRSAPSGFTPTFPQKHGGPSSPSSLGGQPFGKQSPLGTTSVPHPFTAPPTAKEPKASANVPQPPVPSPSPAPGPPTSSATPLTPAVK